MSGKGCRAALAAGAAMLLVGWVAEAKAWDAATPRLPIEARFANPGLDPSRLGQMLGTALGALIETDAAIPVFRVPAAYHGSVDGLLRAIACLNGLDRSYPRPGVIRFTRQTDGNDAACAGPAV